MRDIRKNAEVVTQHLADRGKLIEAGWQTMKAAVLPAGASEAQISDMRMAFFGGASYLFAAVLAVVGPEAEPTEADIRRMSAVQAELDAFELELRTRMKGMQS